MCSCCRLDAAFDYHRLGATFDYCRFSVSFDYYRLGVTFVYRRRSAMFICVIPIQTSKVYLINNKKLKLSICSRI